MGHLYKAKGTFRFPDRPAPLRGRSELVPARWFPWCAAGAGDLIVLPGHAVSAQSGDLDVRDRTAAYHGKVLTSWEEQGSWAEWVIDMPASARCSIVARYATGAKECARRVLLDGKDLCQIHFSGTGGFGQTQQEFDWRLALGADGEPLLANLAKGKHTLRMVHVRGGVALDHLALVPVPAGRKVCLDSRKRSAFPPAKLWAHFSFDEGITPLRACSYVDPDAQQKEIGDSLTDPYLDPADKTGYESGLNFGAFGGSPRGICQYFQVATPRKLEALQFDVRGRDLALPHYTVYLAQVQDTSEAAIEAAQPLCSWPKRTDGTAGLKTLRTTEATPKADDIELVPGVTYAAVFVYDPEGNRRPHKCETHQTAGVSLRADRDAKPRPMLRWFSNNRWGQFNWVTWLAALPRLGPEKKPGPSPRFVAGASGDGVFLSSQFYLAGDVPSDFLSKPGSISLKIKPAWQTQRYSVGQRCLVHVQGERWFAPALSIVTIYGDLRVRLYDDRGHLCGTLEADLTKWKKDEWHEVALSWTEGAMTLTLDGRKAASTERVVLPEGKVSELYFGWRPGNWFLNAAIDEAKIWRGALRWDRVARDQAR